MTYGLGVLIIPYQNLYLLLGTRTPVSKIPTTTLKEPEWQLLHREEKWQGYQG